MMKAITLILFFFALTACTSPSAPVVQITATIPPTTALNDPATATATSSPIPTLPPPATLTPQPTSTSSSTPLATATATATATPAATPTPSGCERRIFTDDLFTIVTLTYGLSRDYQPSDLVDLDDYLPVNVTLGYPTQVRQIIVDPLVQMINAMQANGLAPFIISGYRSYSAQAIAYQKWQTTYPDSASIVSAPPGHSEHQLGTTVDFGSPELEEIVGQEGIEFHTYFYQTSEGQWLLEHAQEYGFTLSFPREAFELTGFYYEPWHYRYVGIEMATQLKAMGLSFTEFQLINSPAPCIP
jgi:D-alanyl-D-alanine carboxypeptidase